MEPKHDKYYKKYVNETQQRMIEDTSVELVV